MKNVYTVRQVNSYIKNMFNQDFMLNRIYVKGEVSNCKYHTSGHIYFSLKDESGTIACIMFAGSRSGLSFRMQEGQQVIVLGYISVYERDGRYQLYARELAEETIDRSRAELDIDARRLTSFVGIDHLKEVDLNLRPWHLRRGDVLLLCSDGISGVLSPPELKEAMSLEPDAGCALLETMVLEKQILEQDNYTGILIAYR